MRDWNKVIDDLASQLKNFLGDRKAVVGISGGIDSSVIAYLCERSVGIKNVIGVMIPYGDQSTVDAELIVEDLHIPRQLVNIKPIVDAFPNVDFMSKLAKGNIMARIRMTVLYNQANSNNGMVIGTTNKTEAAIGYYTKWGDGAVDVEPIADLYKTEVWEIAKVLGVPQKIIDKTPSAELWDGQSDEDELGITYKELDEILKMMSELDVGLAKAHHVCGTEKFDKVVALIDNSEHKRHMPPAFRAYQ